MKDDEVVLSDVHLYSSNSPHEFPTESSSHKLFNEAKTCQSRFVFKLPSSLLNVKEVASTDTIEFDNDGDICIPERNEREIITLDHYMVTPLKYVGLQVWRGAILLSDFILHNHEYFQDQNVLELGAGLGLCSIIVSMFARHVICTDYCDDLLKLSFCNAKKNMHLSRQEWTLQLLPNTDSIEEKPKSNLIKKLDWKTFSKDDPSPRDKQLLDSTTVILAADVIYDNQLTDFFFSTLKKIMTGSKEKCAFISLEKRYNFTIDDLDVTCHAYDYFCEHLKKLKNDLNWKTEKLLLDFPESFELERIPQMELWKITNSVE